MNRNVESHFSQLPAVDIQRSIFDRSFSHKTTFNTGDLVPLYWDEILPGDSVRCTTRKVIRLQTLLTPIFDNAYLDCYWFFVPNRLVWSHWQQFCGENTESAWVPTTTYSIPKIAPPENGFAVGTIADHLGIPIGVEFTPAGEEGSYNYDHFPSSLPFRAYARICQDFFRDQNLTDPLLIPDGDSMQTGSNGDSYISDVANGGMPFKVAKYHDAFTSCLPDVQRGEAVNVPLPHFPAGAFPVVPGSTMIDDPFEGHVNLPAYYLAKLKNTAAGPVWSDSGFVGYIGSTGPFYPDEHLDGSVNSDHGYSSDFPKGASIEDPYAENTDRIYRYPANLEVNIPEVKAGGFTINDLRLAFAAQRYLERLARSGSRYVEILQSFFGVTSPDGRLQRPEYLGGSRCPLQVHQVTNTAQGEADFLGDLGAMSYTADIHADFEKSFTEHGILMCVACVRYDHSYSQGLAKKWTRNQFLDFYLPTMANLGEMPTMTSELYCDGTAPDVFGFNEAWSEYRFAPNTISGEFRPGIPGSLASWHLGDYYTEAPTLSDEWIREDKTNVDRVLAVTSAVSDQVMLDCYFDMTWTRPMPMYSIPGLIDHN